MIQPDIMVVSRELREGADIEDIPLLAVEVLSPTTRRDDLVRKPRILAGVACPHYWVVDPAAGIVTALRLVGHGYQEVARAEGEQLLRVERPFPVQVRLADLLS